MTDMNANQDRINAVIYAILKDEQLSVEIAGSSIVCHAGGLALPLTAEQADALADAIEPETRAQGFDGDDVRAWLAELRRAAIRLRNR